MKNKKLNGIIEILKHIVFLLENPTEGEAEKLQRKCTVLQDDASYWMKRAERLNTIVEAARIYVKATETVGLWSGTAPELLYNNLVTVLASTPEENEISAEEDVTPNGESVE